MNPSPERSWESQSSQKGPRQIHIPKRMLLASLGPAGAAATAIAYLVTPDSRCQIKLSLVQENPAVDTSALGLTLRVTGIDFDQSGPTGEEIPVTNIEPDDGTFQAFPLAANLRGWSREFVTSADEVRIELVVPAAVAPTLATRLFVQARIQPAGQRLPWEEWDEVRTEIKFRMGNRVIR